MQTSVRKREALDGRSQPPLVLRLPPTVRFSEDQFFEFCQLNRDLRIERNAEGELLIMAPTGWQTGAANFEINVQLGLWAKADGSGVATDSSTGYRLPNGA